MELDKTEITIRERSTLELLDLSLLVIKRHAWRLAGAGLIFGAPLMLINVCQTAWMVDADSLLIALDRTSGQDIAHWRHSWHMLVLWCLEFPLASLPITIYLGGQIFYEDLSLVRLVKRMQPLLIRAIFVLGFVRLGLLGWLAEIFVTSTAVFEPLMEVLVLGVCLFGLSMAIRFFSPFAPEILGLEACRLKASPGREPTYWQRGRWLHQSLFGENLARSIACAFAAVCLALMILAIQVFVFGVSLGRWQWNLWFDHLLFPIALWATGVFVAVFRFLAYLDSRIRLEGWEIQLQLLAEAGRWETALSSPQVVKLQESAR